MVKTMNKEQATKIWDNYYNKRTHSKKDDEDLIEALLFLSDDGDIEATAYLGGMYYEMKKFDLAEKYYLIASEEGNVGAMNGLGYIYYYGRLGTPDYEKAFKYYKMSADLGHINSMIKVSDMYKNGYYVEKDLDKSYDILMNAFTEIGEDGNMIFWHYPEVASRIATIKFNKGEIEEGIHYMRQARDVLVDRMARTDSFWGDLTIMSTIESSLFKYDKDINYDACIYNLLELMKTPDKYYFCHYDEEHYTVESIKEEDGTISVKYNEKWFKSIKDFFLYAMVGEEKLTAIAEELRLDESLDSH